MVSLASLSLAMQINWSFTLVEQDSVTRYGVLNGVYYKQFLPGGAVVHNLHPVKKIDKRLYILAQRQLQLRKSSQ